MNEERFTVAACSFFQLSLRCSIIVVGLFLLISSLNCSLRSLNVWAKFNSDKSVERTTFLSHISLSRSLLYCHLKNGRITWTLNIEHVFIAIFPHYYYFYYATHYEKWELRTARTEREKEKMWSENRVIKVDSFEKKRVKKMWGENMTPKRIFNTKMELHELFGMRSLMHNTHHRTPWNFE